MVRKTSTVMLLAVLMILLGVPHAFAQSAVVGNQPTFVKTEKVPPSGSTDRNATRTNEKLRGDVTKLVSDAKTGRARLPDPQNQSANRNNLSKGAKIAIGVSIAVAVIGIVVWRVSWH